MHEGLRLPHSLESEKSLLGGLLTDNSKIPDVIEILNGDEFHREAHRAIYSAVIDLYAGGTPPDIVTVAEALAAKKQIEAVGGYSFLAQLTANITSAANAESYARIIAGKAKSRRLIQSANEILAAAYSGKEADQIAELAEATIFSITGDRRKGRFHHIKEVVKSNLDSLESRKDSVSMAGLPSGYSDLDQLTGGFQKKDLIILAARPSMGKTALALSISRNVAVEGGPVAFFSLEMSKEQLAFRLQCSEARVNLLRARTGVLTDQEHARMLHGGPAVANLPIFIDDTPSISVLELRSKARRLMSDTGLRLIFVDYLQLMRCPRSETREREISEISQSLKALAKELDLPVIALSQLNRKVEDRSDKRPLLSDLRESGALEQDADLIAFIYRDEVYNRDSQNRGFAEIIIGKQRNGPTGTIKLAYLNAFTRFESLTL